jgi:hypothetical protein
MARIEFFARDIKLATAGMEASDISAQLARMARSELSGVISRGEGSKFYETFVNGRAGAQEETVTAPGPIVYRFSWWEEVIPAALEALIKRSPVRSGKYASSFVVISRGRVVMGRKQGFSRSMLSGGGLISTFGNLGAGDEVIITNVQPYTRKIQLGSMEMSVPPRLFDKARSELIRLYGGRSGPFRFEIKFLVLPTGIDPLVPYRLRGRAPLRRAAQNRRSSAFRAGREFLAARRDTAAGQTLTYPSLLMSMNG